MPKFRYTDPASGRTWLAPRELNDNEVDELFGRDVKAPSVAGLAREQVGAFGKETAISTGRRLAPVKEQEQATRFRQGAATIARVGIPTAAMLATSGMGAIPVAGALFASGAGADILARGMEGSGQDLIASGLEGALTAAIPGPGKTVARGLGKGALYGISSETIRSVMAGEGVPSTGRAAFSTFISGLFGGIITKLHMRSALKEILPSTEANDVHEIITDTKTAVSKAGTPALREQLKELQETIAEQTRFPFKPQPVPGVEIPESVKKVRAAYKDIRGPHAGRQLSLLGEEFTPKQARRLVGREVPITVGGERVLAPIRGFSRRGEAAHLEVELPSGREELVGKSELPRVWGRKIADKPLPSLDAEPTLPQEEIPRGIVTKRLTPTMWMFSRLQGTTGLPLYDEVYVTGQNARKASNTAIMSRIQNLAKSASPREYMRGLFKEQNIGDYDRFIDEYVPKIREAGSMERAFPAVELDGKTVAGAIPREVERFKEVFKRNVPTAFRGDERALARTLIDDLSDAEHVRPWAREIRRKYTAPGVQRQLDPTTKGTIESYVEALDAHSDMTTGMIAKSFEHMARRFPSILGGVDARKMANILGGAQHIALLGGNLGAAAQNAWQPLLTAYPYLGKYYKRGLGIALTRAGRKQARALGVTGGPESLAAWTEEALGTEGRFGKIAKMGMVPFSAAEDLNRSSVYFAQTEMTRDALRRARGRDLIKFIDQANLDIGIPREEAVRIARMFAEGDVEGAIHQSGVARVNATQFLYGTGNKPLALESGGGRIAGGFGTFAMSYRTLLGETARAETMSPKKALVISRWLLANTALASAGAAVGLYAGHEHPYLGAIANVGFGPVLYAYGPMVEAYKRIAEEIPESAPLGIAEYIGTGGRKTTYLKGTATAMREAGKLFTPGYYGIKRGLDVADVNVPFFNPEHVRKTKYDRMKPQRNVLQRAIDLTAGLGLAPNPPPPGK